MELVGEKRVVKFDVLKTLVDFPIPDSYISFLKEYGFGNMSEVLFIDNPDDEFFKNNFADYTELWEWEDSSLIKILEHSLKIAHTIDGDTIYLCNYRKPFVILPRHSEKVVIFNSFTEVIDYFIQRYIIDDSVLYFDSCLNAVYKHIAFENSMAENKSDIERIKKSVLFHRLPDRVMKTNSQNLYIIILEA